MTTLDTFVAQLHCAAVAGQLDFSQAKPTFQVYAKSVPEAQRVELLLTVYDRYRGLGCALPSTPDYFHSSTYSMLISALLDCKLKPTEEEACAILRRSYHYCGHGGDVETPLELAEKAFDGKPYSPELFEAVREYQKVLKGTRSITSQNVKRKLRWILWHDPAAIDKKCWMGRAQRDLAAMPEDRRSAWQWLLRNTTATMNGGAGKAWLKEGEKRLAAVGAPDFLSHVDAWLQFPAGTPVVLSPEGSCMLRLLVWYAGLLEPAKVLPMLVRLGDVTWEKEDPAKKVIGALSWILRTHGGEEYREVAEKIAGRFGDTGEGAKLQELYLPDVAAAKKQAMEERGAAFLDLVNALLKS